MSEDDRDIFWVARYRVHPMGGVRYVKDFYTWWLQESQYHSEEVIRQQISWCLTHPQYHLSTADLQSADLIFTGSREVYEKFLDVELVRGTLSLVPAGG